MSVTPLNELNVDTIIEGVQAIIKNAFYTAAPMRTECITNRNVPWLTQELKHNIKRRNQLYKSAKRSNLLLNYEIYR